MKDSILEGETNTVAWDVGVDVVTESGLAGGKLRYPQFDTVVEFDMIVDRSGRVVPWQIHKRPVMVANGCKFFGMISEQPKGLGLM